ncbi:MAG: presqualene diphosphate synthase HpnD [Acidobacteriota bacterium]
MARRDTSFYYSFLALPPRKRHAIVAVWDFCRAVDDAVDEGAAGPDPTSAREAVARELARWRQELQACYGGWDPETPQGRALAPVVSEFGLPRQGFEDVVDGVEMDLGRCCYETFGDLYEYCVRVASAVGLICIEIFGYRDPRSRQYAIDLGIALQLTNILRDLGRDLAAGRLYLPREDLRRFDVSEDDLRAGRVTPAIRQLLEFEAARAAQYYRRADDGLPRRDARRMVAARIMSAIYFDLLKRIERAGFDVFDSVTRAPRRTRALIAARTWAATMMGF